MAIGIGESLAQAREEQGRSIEEAARETRVRADYLRALEEESFGVFGGDVYAKGFLSTYARYLGLDPDPLLEQYRRYVQHDDYKPSAAAIHPVAQPSATGLPAWMAWTVLAVAVLGIAVVAANQLGSRNPDPAPPAPPAPVSTSSPTPRATATATPTPTPTPTFDGVNLAILVEQDTWMRVEVDGVLVESGKIFEPGESPVFQGEQRIRVRFGNAGGVRVELNGQPLGAPGAPGAVVEVVYTPEGRQPPA